MVQNSTNGLRFLKCLEQNGEYLSEIREAICATPRPVGEVFPLASSDEFETGILSALWFVEMESQGDQVREPSQGTFQWIFREPQPNDARWTSFVDWLRKDSGQHIYWITGKAGTGKSTLMKFISNHEETDKLGREQDQRLIARTFPVQWEMFTLLGIPPDSPMTELDLQQALERMIKCNLDTRFIFFVDGIDDLENPDAVVAPFKKPPLFPNIKLCLSSRARTNPKNGSSPGPSLCLEDLNHPDIIQFTQTSLESSRDFSQLRTVSPTQARELVGAIAEKAAGLFLWARIVVSMLLKGLQDGERLSDLRRRLESTPSDLEPLFEKMLDGIPPERIEHASQIFQIVRAAKSPIDLLSLSFADEDDDTLAYDHPIEPLTPDQEAARCDQMQRRLATHCNGLLTTSPSPTTPIPTVHHLHPTIRTYLHRPTTWTRLTTPTPPHLALAHASLLRLRTARLTPTQHHTHTLTNPPPASLAALLLAAVAATAALDAAAAALHADLWDALAATTQTLVARAGLCAAPGCW
ncbi:hypothetical protein GTA08_BOTSDO13653, partial [Neofusicoccum parvum]